MLPPLATEADFEFRIPSGIKPGDAERALASLQDASALVRAEAGKDWMNAAGDAVENVPDVVQSVVMAAAKRAFVNPDGLRSESIDNYATAFASSSPDVYLTKKERQLVRQAAGKSGLWTQQVTRDAPGEGPDTNTVFLDTEPAGDPFPWDVKEPS